MANESNASTKIVQAFITTAMICLIFAFPPALRAAEDNLKEIARANALSASGNKYQAIKILSAIIARSPNDVIARLNRGNILFVVHRYDLAFEDGRQSAQIDLKNQHAFYLMGICQEEMQHPEEALKYFDKAITLKGADVAGIHRDRAKVLLKLQKLDAAKKEIVQAQNMDKSAGEKNADVLVADSIDRAIIWRGLINPNSQDAVLMAKAQDLYLANKQVECLQVLEHILTHDAKNVAAHELKGDILCEVDEAKAIAEMKIVIEAYPNYQHAYAVIAESLVRLKQYQEAFTAAEHALKIGGPEQGAAHRFKSFALLYMHRFKEARAETDEALKLHPWGVERHKDVLNRIELDRFLHDYPALLADCDERLKLGQYLNSKDWVERGNAYMLLGKTDQAIHDFEKANSFSDSERGALKGLAEAYAKKGDKAKEQKARAVMKALDYEYATDKELQSRPDLKAVESKNNSK